MPKNDSMSLRISKLSAENTEIGTGAKFQVFTAGYGTKLCEWTWTGPMFNSPSNGSMTSVAPDVISVTPLAAGTAAVGRITKANGTTVVSDGYIVGVTGTPGVEVIVSDTDVVTTENQSLGSITINQPA